MTGVSGRRLPTCLRGSGAALMAPRTGDSPASPAGAICTRAACTRSAAGAGSAGRGSPACRPAVLMNTISGARPDRMENQVELCAARLRLPSAARASAARRRASVSGPAVCCCVSPARVRSDRAAGYPRRHVCLLEVCTAAPPAQQRDNDRPRRQTRPGLPWSTAASAG